MSQTPSDARGRTGRRAPNMADVAAAAGVSHQTVSRVLNGSDRVKESTRERVLEAIERLGYRRNYAARVLATNRSHRIGMIAGHLELHGPSMIAVAVQTAGHAAGYDVSLVAVQDFTARSLAGAVERLLDEAVEVVVVAVAHRDAMEQALSLELPVPMILVQGVSAGQPMAAGIDQLEGAQLAVDHLLDLGHRRIAHVSGPSEWVEAGQRRAGWRAAHERRGLEPGPEVAGDWSAASGYEAGRRLADDPEITAVFAANDSMALGVLHALHDRGRAVPDEVSVVGFDDGPESAHYWPALTTVNQEFSLLGRRALDLAVRALEGEPEPRTGLIRPALVVRASTAPPRTARS